MMRYRSISYFNKKHYLCISDIHFYKLSPEYNYDANIFYDYFIYAGDLIRLNPPNENTLDIIISFFKSIKAVKKIILMGNNDSVDLANILKVRLNKNMYNDPTKFYYVIHESCIVDNIFCSSFSMRHGNSKNLFRCDDEKLLPYQETKNVCNIYLTHGKLPKETLSKFKDKLFIFGHDHLSPVEEDKLSYIEYDPISRNTYVNVSVGEYSLVDRRVYFTHIETFSDSERFEKDFNIKKKYIIKNYIIRLFVEDEGVVQVIPKEYNPDVPINNKILIKVKFNNKKFKPNNTQ